MSCKISKKVETKVVFNCDKCTASIMGDDLEKLKKEAKGDGWYIECSSFPIREDTINSVLCPVCYKKKREEMQKSGDIYEAVRGGKYENKEPYSKENKEKYRQESYRLQDQFKHDALVYFGIDKHPKAQLAFSLAWDHGHSGGYSDVLCYLSDFSDLLK